MPTLNARENAVQHERGGYWTYKGPDTTENDATGSDKRSQQRPRNPGQNVGRDDAPVVTEIADRAERI
ncbi:hypothetical protein CIRG_05381 [Coccidioides immitis RMSCC 2394]|uniref:Uncharacterized protein n=1 Tax=Coccidioides immitis RMSCC 2394 TaxID=404692 RepID=A0A0J6YDD7_COCIT|nr:hypothetical protein CIRG_05381 [Coccidioides immitis RMSCC 2394]